MTTGQFLTTFREKKGWSQRYLAKRLGFPHANISLIESDKIYPSLYLLKQYSILGLPIIKFFDECTIIQKPNPRRKE